MDISKVHFAYFTPIMLTRKIVYNVAHTLSNGLPSQQYNLTSVIERTRQHQIGSDELLIAALPAFGGRVPVIDPPLLRNLHGNNTPAVIITTYGGRGYDDTLIEMQRILTEQGFVTIAGAAFVCKHSVAPQDVCVNRPNEADLQLARDFGTQVRQKVNSAENLSSIEASTIPGTFPYTASGMPQGGGVAPITTDECILCMQCYRWCPTDAIPYNDPNHTYADKCMLCHGCIVRCPVDARKVVNEGFMEKTNMLIANFKDVNPDSEIFL